MTGSGNDFVMVDGRHTSPGEWSEADIRAVCARGTGVGADGLVFVGPGSAPNAVRMIYFNSDGSRAAMCSNAALCSTCLAARLGLAPKPVPRLAASDGEQRVALGIVGVPHLVVLVDDVSCVDLEPRGRALRSDPALGPDGANVNFVSPRSSPSEWSMRTYERGVEAETLACGTGAVAAACAVMEWGVGQLPVTIWTRSGRCLEIEAKRLADGSYDEVWLSGEARLVLRGVIN